MSKTALLWVVAYGGALVMSLVDPFYALAAYLLDYYAHPPLRWWGRALPEVRWSLLAAAVFLAAYLLHGRSLLDRAILRHAETRWLLGLLAVAAAVTPFAVETGRSLHYLTDLAKLALLYMLIVGTVRTRAQFGWFALIMIGGAFLWGVDAYRDPDRVAGRLQGVGGPDSDADNSTAAHLVTVLPFLGVYLWKGRPWERLAALVAAPFVLNAIILCNSRGASVAMAVMGGAALLLTRGRVRVVTAVALVAAGLLLVRLVDAPFVERQVSLFSSELDTSSSGRLETWTGALALMRDRPLGAGGGGWDALSPVYAPEVVERFGGEERAVHNTYLLVGTDWGVPGLVLFLGFIGATLRRLHRVRASGVDERTSLESLALEIGLIGFLVAAFFINRAYAEVLYWFAGLSAALWNICETQIARSTLEAPAAAMAPAEPGAASAA